MMIFFINRTCTKGGQNMFHPQSPATPYTFSECMVNLNPPNGDRRKGTPIIDLNQ